MSVGPFSSLLLFRIILLWIPSHHTQLLKYLSYYLWIFVKPIIWFSIFLCPYFFLKKQQQQQQQHNALPNMTSSLKYIMECSFTRLSHRHQWVISTTMELAYTLRFSWDRELVNFNALTKFFVSFALVMFCYVLEWGYACPIKHWGVFSPLLPRTICIPLVLSLLLTFDGNLVKPSGPRVPLVGRFMTTNSISLMDTGLFRVSTSSLVNFGQ